MPAVDRSVNTFVELGPACTLLCGPVHARFCCSNTVETNVFSTLSWIRWYNWGFWIVRSNQPPALTLEPLAIDVRGGRIRRFPLIAEGEHERLEFKQTLRWDVMGNQVNKKLADLVASGSPSKPSSVGEATRQPSPLVTDFIGQPDGNVHSAARLCGSAHLFRQDRLDRASRWRGWPQ